MAYPKANLKFVSYTTLRSLPAPEMLISDLIPMEGIVALSADPNIGKTFLMMEMAKCVVTGSPFLGHFPTRRGSVLFVGQDASVLDYAQQVRKLSGEQWLQYEALLEVQREELGDRPELVNPFDDLMQYILQPGFYFEDKGHCASLVEAVKAYEHSRLDKKNVLRHDGQALRVDVIEEHKNGFDLILFDTFASMKMLDENSNTDMQICMNNARYIADQTGAAIVFSHHHDKMFERLRGASVLSASADVHIELKKKREGGTIQERWVDTAVTIKKFRGMKLDPFMYRLTTSKDKATIIYQDKPAEGQPPTDKPSDPETTLEYQTAADAWARMLAATEPASPIRITALLAHIRTMGEVSSSTLYRWMERFQKTHVPVGHLKVVKQAITLTESGRQSAIFSLGSANEKE